MSKPDFIVFAAPKSGTTSVYHYLRQHPQIHMSALKEPGFFLFDGPQQPRMLGPHDVVRKREMLKDWDTYQSLFAGLPTDGLSGEASVRYLYSGQACGAIRRRLPRVKLIAVLRHPVDRAYSAFRRDRAQGVESLTDCHAAIADSPRRERAGWWNGSYLHLGYYSRYLEPYLRTFPDDQLRVFVYDDLRRDPDGFMRDLFEFLGVDPEFEPNLNQRFNVTGVIKNPVWRLLWSRTRRIRSHLMPLVPVSWRGTFVNLAAGLPVRPAKNSGPLDPEMRARLTEIFRDDILKLQDLIGRDLSFWLEQRPGSGRISS